MINLTEGKMDRLEKLEKFLKKINEIAVNILFFIIIATFSLITIEFYILLTTTF